MPPALPETLSPPGTSSLPPKLREWVEREYLAQFKLEQPVGVRTAISVQSIVEYARERGLSHRARKNKYEIARFLKKAVRPTRSLSLPIIILSRYNAMGADCIGPGQHLAFLTPSRTFGKVARLESFHLMIRGISHEETARETARYMGRYTMHDPEKILSYEEYRQLDLRHRLSAGIFVKEDQRNPTLSEQDVENLFHTGKYHMRLLIFECSGFSPEFYQTIRQKDIVTPMSVKPATRKTPNWSEIHAQEVKQKSMASHK